MFNIRLVPKMFNIRCLTSEPNEKEKKANVHLGQVRHAFARNVKDKENLRKRKSTISGAGVALCVQISVCSSRCGILLNPQCLPLSVPPPPPPPPPPSRICAAQPAATCCAHAITSSCDPRGANSGGVTRGGTLGGYPPRRPLRGHFSSNPPPLQPPRIHQVAISLFRPPGKT